MWITVYVKVGSGLDFAINDYISRAQSLPELKVTGGPDDYRNWSILPLALDRLLGVNTPRAAAIAHCLILVAGTSTILAWAAHRRPEATYRILAVFVATPVPALAFFFMGSYDQLLVVTLVGFAVAQNASSNLLAGAMLGLTHAEIGLLAVGGVLALSWAEIGPPLKARLPAAVGVIAAKAALAVWIAAAGNSTSRLTFIGQYGVGKLLSHFASTWPIAVWSLAGTAWIVVIAVLADRPPRRLLTALAALAAVTLIAVSVTVDSSRVAMLCTLAPLLVLAAHEPTSARISGAVHIAAILGALTPLTIAWAGDAHALGNPLTLGW